MAYWQYSGLNLPYNHYDPFSTRSTYGDPLNNLYNPSYTNPMGMMMYSCVPAGVGTQIKFQEQGSCREDIDAGYTQIRKKKIEDRLERHQTRELDHMEQLNNQIDVLNKLNKEQLKFKYQQDKLAKLSKHRFYEQFEKQGQKDNEKLQEFARVLQSFDKFQENFEKESAEIKEEGTRLTRDLSIVYVVRKASFDFCIDSNFTLYYQNLQKLAKNMQMEHKSMTENHIRFQARFNKHVGSRSSEKTIDFKKLCLKLKLPYTKVDSD